MAYSVGVERRAQKQIARLSTGMQDRVEAPLSEPSPRIPVREGAVGSRTARAGASALVNTASSTR
jgi:hypothetical protein